MDECVSGCGTTQMARLFSRLSVGVNEVVCRLGLKKRQKSNFIQHAEREFLAAGYVPLRKAQEDGPDKWIQQNVIELLDVFARQGHSGFSAEYCIETFSKLAKFKPLVPLQGTDDEWNEVGDGVFQNNRCSHVFKQADRFDGQAYDINGRIFREPGGGCYTSGDSFVPVTFPYSPRSEYVDVEG
jgi:hypothetical protein